MTRARFPVALAVTAAAVAAAVGVPALVLDQPRPPAVAVGRASVVPVADATRICPDPSGMARRTRTTVAVGTPAVPVQGGGIGQAGPFLGQPTVRLAPLTGTPAELYRDSGHVVTRVLDRRSPPLVVTAHGAPAAAVEATQLSRTDGGPARGLAAVRCVQPGERFTFVGVGTRVGEDPRLVLTNDADIPALVDVTVIGDHGPLPAGAGQGIEVGPQRRMTLRLIGLAPDRSPLAVTVTARTGRVAAALHDTRRHGNVAEGVDWVAPAAAPSTAVVVPGIQGRAGARHRLTILDPGSTDASVRVAVLDAAGSVVPTGLDSVLVAAGSVASVDLGRAVGAGAAALRITSDQPVQATVTSAQRGQGGVADTAFEVGSPAVTDAAVPMPLALAGGRQVAAVQLVAPVGDARVQLVPIRPGATGDARPATRIVTVRGGTVRVVQLGRDVPATAPMGLEIDVLPGSGPVHAAATWYEADSRGPLATVLPLTAERRTVLRPVTHPDPLAPLPDH